MCCVDIPGVCFGDGFCLDTAFAALVSLLLSCAKLTQGDVLLFFFTKKKKRSKKRKDLAYPCSERQCYATTGSVCDSSVKPVDKSNLISHPFTIRGGIFNRFFRHKSPGGVIGSLSAVTLPFLNVKLGGKAQQQACCLC
jgi:hypothetical protein